MINIKIITKEQHKTQKQLANQFSLGMYGLSLDDFANKIIGEVREEKKAGEKACSCLRAM